MDQVIDNIVITPLEIIPTSSGKVMHAMKSSDKEYSGFGEGYFSYIESGKIRAWKYHNLMTSNIVVPMGKIKFVFFENNNFKEFVVGNDNYCRITIPPKIWFGFQSISNEGSMLLNISNIKHDPNEVISKEINEINYNWV